MQKSFAVSGGIALAMIVAQPVLAPPAAAQSAPAGTAAGAPLALGDPVRLAAAQITVDRIFPEGTYARMMNGMLDKVMESAMAGVGKIPLRELARIGGASEADVARLGQASLHEMMALIDPVYDQRNRIAMRVMGEGMGAVMSSLEPQMRQGLARAYANRFTTSQLGELNAFFATPTGSLYARDSMVIFMDPAVMEAMQAAMPKLMAQMAPLVEKVRKATEALPPPRKFSDLSPADQARFSALMKGHSN